MLTASITAAIVFICSLFGYKPDLAQIAAIAVFVKVVVVIGIFGGTAKFMAWRKARAELLAQTNGETNVR